MSYTEFYDLLFKPVTERVGPIDPETLVAIVGFDAGGSLSLCTVDRGNEFVTYVSCELAVRDDMHVGDSGPYELMTTCDDESWARTVLTSIARLGQEAELGDGHTIDLEQVVGKEPRIQGVALEEFASVSIKGAPYRILRVHGLTRNELTFAFERGVDALLERRRNAGDFPRTRVD